jgi:hypothetical protein
MSRLSDFLALPNASDVTEEIFVNDRLGVFTVKPMTVAQHKTYQDRCRLRVDKGGVSFDSAKFNLLVTAGQVLDPDFSDADFLQKTGYPSATEFIKAKFYSGEVASISEKICRLSGFDEDINDKVDEAKNL